jgi:hypothetical protein
MLDATHLHTGLAPTLVLLLLRLFNVAFFIFTVFWEQFGPSCCASGTSAGWMIFFTNWSFVGFGLQAVAGSLATATVRGVTCLTCLT